MRKMCNLHCRLLRVSNPKNYGSFEYRFSSSPSQGGETGSTPVGAIQKKQKESNREVSAPTGGKVPRMAPNNLAKA